MIVFHALQASQRPDHFEWTAPQAEQEKEADFTIGLVMPQEFGQVKPDYGQAEARIFLNAFRL
jgi:hypothetical protein